MRRLALTLAALALASAPSAAQQIPADYQQVLTTLGRTGDYASNVLKVNIPRNDVSVTVAGMKTPTPFGFGGWVAMTKGQGSDNVLMGDLVLKQDEVNPVMSKLLENGFDVTALHNHFFQDEPRMFFMHVHGHGTPADLARRIKPALDMIPKGAPASGAPAKPTIDTAKVASIIGHQGDTTGAVYKITIGRDDLHLTEMGAPINARMGLNTWAAFIGTDDKAAVAGDIAMLASEVTPVLKALREHHIEIVAIHQHMTTTTPTIFFLHYWGTGPAATLAQGVRAAVDVLGKK